MLLEARREPRRAARLAAINAIVFDVAVSSWQPPVRPAFQSPEVTMRCAFVRVMQYCALFNCARVSTPCAMRKTFPAKRAHLHLVLGSGTAYSKLKRTVTAVQYASAQCIPSQKAMR